MPQLIKVKEELNKSMITVERRQHLFYQKLVEQLDKNHQRLRKSQQYHQTDLINIYKTFQQTSTKYAFFSNVQGTYTKIRQHSGPIK